MKQMLDERVIVPNSSQAGTHDTKKHVVYVDGERRKIVKIPTVLFEELGG